MIEVPGGERDERADRTGIVSMAPAQGTAHAFEGGVAGRDRLGAGGRWCAERGFQAGGQADRGVDRLLGAVR